MVALLLVALVSLSSCHWGSQPSTEQILTEVIKAKRARIDMVKANTVKVNVFCLDPESPPEELDKLGYKYMGHGSGVVLKDGYIATAAHVTDALDNPLCAIKIKGKEAYLEYKNKTTDVAILYYPEHRIKGVTGLKLGEIKEGDSVVCVGYSSQVANGNRSQLQVNHGTYMLYLKSRKLGKISCSFSPGASGGPVVDEAGRVVGLMVRYRTKAPYEFYSTSLTELKKALERAKAKNN